MTQTISELLDKLEKCAMFAAVASSAEDHYTNDRVKAKARADIEARVAELERILYATKLLSDLYKEALTWILDSPYGCPYCDSGVLRNTQKAHDDRCGFAKAVDLIGASNGH